MPRRKVTAETANQDWAKLSNEEVRILAETGHEGAARELDNRNNDASSEDTMDNDNTASEDNADALIEGDTSEDTGTEDTGTEDNDNTASEDTGGIGWDCDFPVGVSPREGSKAAKANFAAFTCVVNRSAAKTYTARSGRTEGDAGSTAKVAVNNLLRKMKQVPGDFDFQGLDNEPRKPTDREGSNEPDAKAAPWHTNPVESDYLNARAEDMAVADDTVTNAEVAAKEGYLAIGRAAKAALDRIAGYSEGAGINWALWSLWLKEQTNAGGVLAGRERFAKNFVSEAIAMAGMPEALLAMLPRSWNSPKMAARFVNEAQREMAADAVKNLYADKDAKLSEEEGGDKLPISATNLELSGALASRVGYMRDRLDPNEGEDYKAARTRMQLAQKDPDAPKADLDSYLSSEAHRRKELVAVYDWRAASLPADTSPTFEADFVSHPLGKALVAAWGNLMKEVAAKRTEPKPGREDEDTAGGEDTGGTAAPVKFADMSQEDAARHLYTFLASREDDNDREEILAIVQRMIADRTAAAEKAAERQEDAAEGEAAQ